jgi:ABC-type uncharacterized transport system ATPase subunit
MHLTEVLLTRCLVRMQDLIGERLEGKTIIVIAHRLEDVLR